MTKARLTTLFGAVLLLHITSTSAQTGTEPTTAASLPEQTAVEPIQKQTAEVAAPKAVLSNNQIPKLLIRWDCGDCVLNDKVPPLIEKTYAEKATAKGYSVSDTETAEMVIIKYRQRPPAARVFLGFMAGKDLLETRVTFRGKEFLAGDYSANAVHGMDSLCETVAQMTVDQMTARIQAYADGAAAHDKNRAQ